MAHKACGTDFDSHLFSSGSKWGRVGLNVSVKSLRKGLVMKCSTDEQGVEPAVVAQKIYFWTFDKNLTESELINTVKDPTEYILDTFSPFSFDLLVEKSVDPCLKQFPRPA